MFAILLRPGIAPTTVISFKPDANLFCMDYDFGKGFLHDISDKSSHFNDIFTDKVMRISHAQPR